MIPRYPSAPQGKRSRKPVATKKSVSGAAKRSRKEKIPATIRNVVWYNHMGDASRGLCTCCQAEYISKANFAAGHIHAEREGGAVTTDNLQPICNLCNSSMGTMNMHDFMQKYHLPGPSRGNFLWYYGGVVWKYFSSLWGGSQQS